MTKQKILSATGDELSLLLTIVLLGDERPPYIDLTPAEAFKWRDWLRENFTYEQVTAAMVTIFSIGVDDDTGRINALDPENMKHQAHYWFAVHAEEKDWLKLATLCKLEDE